MVGVGNDYARHVYGRARRDGGQCGYPDDHVGVPYPDFVGRMGHHRLYDYDDDYAAVGRLVGRPVRQQETLLGWNGYFYVGIVALRACGNRRFLDCCTGVTGSWQRHDPVARTGHRHA